MNFIYNFPDSSRDINDYKDMLFNEYYYNVSKNVIMYDGDKRLMIKIDEQFNENNFILNDIQTKEDYLLYLINKLGINDVIDSYDYGFIKTIGGKDKYEPEDKSLVKDYYYNITNTSLYDNLYSFTTSEFGTNVDYVDSIGPEYGKGRVYNTILLLNFIDNQSLINFISSYSFKYRYKETVNFNNVNSDLGFSYYFLIDNIYPTSFYLDTDKVNSLSYYLFEFFGLGSDDKLILDLTNGIDELNVELSNLSNLILNKDEEINLLQLEISRLLADVKTEIDLSDLSEVLISKYNLLPNMLYCDDVIELKYKLSLLENEVDILIRSYDIDLLKVSNEVFLNRYNILKLDMLTYNVDLFIVKGNGMVWNNEVESKMYGKGLLGTFDKQLKDLKVLYDRYKFSSSESNSTSDSVSSSEGLFYVSKGSKTGFNNFYGSGGSLYGRL